MVEEEQGIIEEFTFTLPKSTVNRNRTSLLDSPDGGKSTDTS